MTDSNNHGMTDRRTYLKTAAVGTIGGLAGCTGAFGGSQWQRQLSVVTPETGPIGFIGNGIIQGAKVALDEVNQESDREDISISVADSAGQVEQARSAVQGAIDEGAVGITGPISSDVTIALRNLLEEEEVPQLTPQAGNPSITEPGTDFSFRFPGDEEQKEFGTMQFLAEQDVSSLAIIAADYSYPRTTVEFAKEFAPQFDISIEHEAFVPLGTDNFKPVLNEIDDQDVDAMFLPYPGANGVTLIQQIREEGLFENNVILGDYGYGSTPYVNALQEDIQNVNNWGADLTSDKSQDVISRIEDRFDTRAGIYHVEGYDSMKMMANAVNNAESLDPVAVRDALRDTSYEAASGWTVEFGEHGHCTTYRLIVNQWEQSGDGFVNARRFRSDTIPPNPSR
jgi:ABC-type branched-subunit amino acid transport system substrate-binding protein